MMAVGLEDDAMDVLIIGLTVWDDWLLRLPCNIEQNAFSRIDRVYSKGHQCMTVYSKGHKCMTV